MYKARYFMSSLKWTSRSISCLLLLENIQKVWGIAEQLHFNQTYCILAKSLTNLTVTAGKSFKIFFSLDQYKLLFVPMWYLSGGINTLPLSSVFPLRTYQAKQHLRLCFCKEKESSLKWNFLAHFLLSWINYKEAVSLSLHFLHINSKYET